MSPVEPIEFFVAGHPSTKGSARAFVVKGRAIVTNDAGPKAKAWASQVTDAARAAMGARPVLDGPVRVDLAFYLPRPQSHYTKRGLRPEAPSHAATKPDGDKLQRCLWDALTGVVFVDDSRIVSGSVEKLYSNDGRTGARVVVRAMGAARSAAVQPALLPADGPEIR